MKKNYILLALTGALALGMTSCSDILDEQARSSYDPTFFSSKQGVEGGLTSLYCDLRNLYGNGYVYSALETGTDEYTYAQSGNGENFTSMDLAEGAPRITSTNCDAGRFWDVFPFINTANGVIENAEKGGMDASMIAEAYFFRAFYYFHLVRNFGGVPLDLGSGELKFNSSPVRTSVRNTVADVYLKCIFPDLEKAVADLPENPRVEGAVTKTVARTYLAKAYLTYAWWLKNPNGVPTYPECERDASQAANYFKKEYDTALTAIKNPGPYALQPTYYDVNVATNDRNSEWLLWADHTDQSDQYNGVGKFAWGNGASPENFASWFPCCNYTLINVDGVSAVQRDLVPGLGRPWTRIAPVIEVFTKTFADKTNDSRYDGTFTYCFRANWQKASPTADGYRKTITGANGMTINAGPWGDYAADVEGHNYGLGDPVLTFLNEDNPNVDYTGNNAGVSAGVLPGRADYVINPSGITRQLYPVVWKIGPYSKDNLTGYGAGVNSGSVRPYVIAKFSELYFIAAEAQVMGASGDMSARDLINVIRARAGKWRWDNNNGVAKIEDHSAEMVAATPAEITIEYIMQERSREYFGEGHRWYELTRTQTWEKLAGTYHMGGMTFAEHTNALNKRNITKDLYLRPIPQGQLDGMEMAKDEKALYQNPAYRD